MPPACWPFWKRRAWCARRAALIEDGATLQMVVRAFVAPMAGRQAAEHVRRRAGRAVEVAGKDLTDAQREAFYGALDSIIGNLRVLTKEGIPE